jgi:hypothetical protein
LTGRHRPDNRHAPLGDPCRCRRPAVDHRVSHTPKGDPCTTCNLPASSHITRRSVRTPKNVIALRKRDGWMCQICREAFADPSPEHPDPMSVTVDHLLPVWKGGTDALPNLRLAHRICNMRRGGVELSPAQLSRNERALARLETLTITATTGSLSQPPTAARAAKRCESDRMSARLPQSPSEEHLHADSPVRQPPRKRKRR